MDPIKHVKHDEKGIVTGILSGQERSLLQFLNHYKRPLSTFIGRRVDNTHDLEEILQDTFLAAIESMRDFAFRSSLFTYLCSIASHKIIDYYRRKKIKNIVFSRMTDVEPLLATLFGPEESLDEEILRQKIAETFKKIAPLYGKILKLKYVYGYSVTEIAQKLSISFKSAESTLFRARRAFAAAYSI